MNVDRCNVNKNYYEVMLGRTLSGMLPAMFLFTFSVLAKRTFPPATYSGRSPTPACKIFLRMNLFSSSASISWWFILVVYGVKCQGARVISPRSMSNFFFFTEEL